MIALQFIAVGLAAAVVIFVGKTVFTAHNVPVLGSFFGSV